MSTLEVNFIYVLTLGPLLFPGARSTWRRSAVKSQRRFRSSFATGKNITRQTRWRDHWNRPSVLFSSVCADFVIPFERTSQVVAQILRMVWWLDWQIPCWDEDDLRRNAHKDLDYFCRGLLQSSAFFSTQSNVYFIHIFGHHLGVNSGKIYAEIKPACTVRSSKIACHPTYLPMVNSSYLHVFWQRNQTTKSPLWSTYMGNNSNDRKTLIGRV